MSTRIPVARFRVGDKVAVTPEEAECAPFVGWIIGSEYRSCEIAYDVAENEDGSMSSGAWPEDMIAPTS